LIGLNIKEPDISTVNDVLDAAAKLRKAGKAVPRDAMSIIVEGAKI
jgi:flagellar basal body P-ring protein FlgI